MNGHLEDLPSKHVPPEPVLQGCTRLSPSRVQALRERLLDAVEALRRRRAGALSEADLEDYVSLGWLRWHGGGLRPTAAGQALIQRLVATLRARSEAEPVGIASDAV